MHPMNDSFAPCVGGVVSADIAVPEHERELRFYSRVLGTGDVQSSSIGPQLSIMARA